MRDKLFRDDINGLRALAVSLVLAFHFKIEGFNGGFIGVDAFFVISGYLMTQIITRGFDEGKFSISKFYIARVRRIVPALLFMCTCAMIFGVYFLDPVALESLAKESVSALGFWSNILFATQSGYFNTAAEEHWLLHTWSLSVEWQFYILYPILFMIFKYTKLSDKYILICLFTISLISLLLSEILLHMPKAASGWYFYMLPNRAWEMLTGGIVVFIMKVWEPKRWLGLTLHYGGLLSLVLCAIFLDKTTPWPSLMTLLPVLGTTAVLISGFPNATWSRILPVRLFGTWSYSMYLWHWPLVAAVNYFNLTGPWVVPALVLGSILLAFGSYEIIEKRFTTLIFASGDWRLKSLLSLTPVLILGCVLWMTTGLESLRVQNPQRLHALQEIRKANEDWAFRESCTGGIVQKGQLELCYVGDAKSINTVVVGDSHAQQLAPRYAAIFKNRPGGVLFVTSGGCIPVRGVSQKGMYASCGDKVQEAYDFVQKSSFRNIIFVSLWIGYFREEGKAHGTHDLCFLLSGKCQSVDDLADYQAHLTRVLKGFSSDIQSLKQAGHQVTVVDLIPVATVDLKEHYLTVFRGGPIAPAPIDRQAFDNSTAVSRNLIMNAAKAGGSNIINPRDMICSAYICPTYDKMRILYKDSAHYRASVMTDARFGFLDPIIINKSSSSSFNRTIK